MTVCIHDHTANAAGTAQLPGLRELQNQPGVRFVVWPEDVLDNSVVFVHAGNEVGRRATNWRSIAGIPKRKYIIFVSSEFRALTSEVSPVFSCHRNFKEVFDTGDVTKIAASLNGGSDPGQLLETLDLAAILAFCVMCEAWQACDGKGSGDYHGIRIHAPQSLPDWCAPFGARPAAEVSAMVGSGDVGAKAKAVLDAVNGNGSPKLAIDEFLKATAASRGG